MRVAVFNTKPYDRQFFEKIHQNFNHELHFFEPKLNRQTANLAMSFPAVCVFVQDNLDRYVLKNLAKGGTKLIALRCAGYNNVDLRAAKELNIKVVRVPAYSPYAVAEHAVALILTLNRKIPRAYYRVREGNFSLDGLLGFDLKDSTVGIVGTGKIGRVTGKILHGFGCQILAYDPYPNDEFAEKYATYVSLEKLLSQSDIISLHCPLTKETHHLINHHTISMMKPGVMLVNTSRGGLIDTKATIKGLKSQHIGYLALDVYENENELFFQDLSNQVIQDDTFGRLLTFPNVIITGHQAFFTQNALENIATTTLSNISDIEQNSFCHNQIDDSELNQLAKTA